MEENYPVPSFGDKTEILFLDLKENGIGYLFKSSGNFTLRIRDLMWIIPWEQIQNMKDIHGRMDIFNQMNAEILKEKMLLAKNKNQHE